MQATLFRLEEREFVLGLAFHHIIIDGLSMPTLSVSYPLTTRLWPRATQRCCRP